MSEMAKAYNPHEVETTLYEWWEKNGFFILIDNKQAEHLDQEYTVSSKTEVSFVKLTLLVGG